MNNKKLSIITVNLNNLDGLKKTVESVLSQTWQEFEYIVIDGGSTDGSQAYIESQSNCIDYWVSEPDTGIYNAMNKGIAKASGEYLLFLNSGDHFFDNDVLNNNIEQMQKNDLISFNLNIVGDNSTYLFSLPDSLRFSDMYFDFMPHPATFIKKELFYTIGFYDEDLKIVADWKFFALALFRYNCSFLKVNKTLSTFYLGGISSHAEASNEKKSVINECFGGTILDYEELKMYRKMLRNSNLKRVIEIEKTIFGKKIVTMFLRNYLRIKNKIL